MAFIDKELLQRYLEGNCSQEEVKLVQDWYAKINVDQRIFLSEECLESNEHLMRKQVMNITGPEYIRWRRWISYAAALVLTIGTTYFFLNVRPVGNQHKTATIDQKRTIVPGSTAATLVLADGRVMDLSKGNLQDIDLGTDVISGRSEAGKMTYESSGNGKIKGDSPIINILRTGKGQTYRLQLPDGSNVWLNAESELHFAINMADIAERRVVLKGEAYFEVAKDASHPFVVQTDASSGLPMQEVRVLGTHFNINSYPEELSSKTTLLEGSIKLSVPTLKLDRILVPEDQASVTGKNIVMSKVNSEEEVAWKDGFFYFDKSDVRTVMNQIARWYDIKVVYNDGVPTDKISGKINRNAQFGEALTILKYLGINYKIDGRTVYIQ